MEKLIEICHYLTRAGKDVFDEWLTRLGDSRTQAKIAARMNRLAAGNFGDCKPLRGGVWELRIRWGPGYRVYYARADRTCVLLLCGGEKGTQSADIERAIECWADYKQRTSRE